MNGTETEVIFRMRSIANAGSEDEFNQTVSTLKQSMEWSENNMFQKWFQTYWLAYSEVSEIS